MPKTSNKRPEAEPLLTPNEVANLFRVDPKTVTRWAKQGKLTYLRTLGGHRRYREHEVRALLHGAPAEPAPQARPAETARPLRTVSIDTATREHTRMDADVQLEDPVLALREADGVLTGVCRIDDSYPGDLDEAAAAYARRHGAVVDEAGEIQ